MELDCRVCGKAYGRGADQPSKCVQVFSSPIIHDLFNDSSWCNEQSYLGEKGLPSPGIEPKTFRFPCRRSNHCTELRGWDDSTRRNFFTQLCLAFRAVLTLHGLCAMGTTPAAAMAVLGVISVQHFCPFEGSQTRSKQLPGLGAMGTTPAAEISVRLSGFGI